MNLSSHQKLLNKAKELNVDEIMGELIAKCPVPIAAIAETLGITVRDSDALYESECGKIYRNNDKYYIDVNRKHSASRRRFTIAHEIGHFICHFDKLQKTARF